MRVFHESKYMVEDVRATAPLADWLLNFTKQILARKASSVAQYQAHAQPP